MNKVLVITAIAEASFGMFLLAFPLFVIRLLLGRVLAGPVGMGGRVVGFGLVALGIGCWPRGDSRVARSVMLAWSLLAMAGLIIVGLQGLVGILLWPAFVVHGVVAALLWWTGRE